MEYADVFIGKFDDARMIYVMGKENATQRGNSGTAITGTVASALYFLMKDILTGGNVAQNWATSPKAIETLRGQIASTKGLGRGIIEKFLDGIPDVTESSITAQLANLKSSGHYAKIVGDISKEIKKEKRKKQLLSRWRSAGSKKPKQRPKKGSRDEKKRKKGPKPQQKH